ncbi:MAG TPA: type II toxin-antitoxin system RelE/ParE family toxin [Candidatus Acidoferrales bacterium]|nr:type II toxin-antitoxin system RelE/ParE family toxin [Candidatus Acidoferrales bacterium]
MSARFRLTRQAAADLDAIWQYIAKDNPAAAEKVEAEIVACCERLAEHPHMGTKRPDITGANVRFWAVTKYPNFIIVYRPEGPPLVVVAVLHAKRELGKVLGERA